MAFLKNISSTNQSDTELVLAYRQSDDLKVLGELYQRYMELVYGVCLKYLKEPELAQDAVMQIFEELVSKLKKHEVENFRGWLHQVAKNYCLMQLRTPKNLKTVALPPLLMQNEEDVHLNGMMSEGTSWMEKEENLQKLEECIASLADEQRTMIKLFYLDGKCYNEIVEITGMEWNHVRSSIQNGRRNLKLCMEKKEAMKKI
ncbi:MAG: sigma-70 family RNA polymerase sigma factor [Bacteroidetes bacterium]|nr:MAG: sigma-70 family RNA polymerase sigma factor [Bacteroidota bacterium]